VATLADLERRIEHCRRSLADVERAFDSACRIAVIQQVLRFDTEDLTLSALIDALADRN